jgi:subfamily B ATP-binding cassette protein MsbA
VLAPRLRGRIAFEGVHFEYEPGRPALRDVNLEVAAGRVTAIVGPTGCGKTTLTSLVPRLYDPTRGVVRIDGRDVRDFTLASLRGQVGTVLQESVLLDGTIAENIAYGGHDASMEQVVAAARAAGAHEFIEELPDGYETEVGERGGTLSGGQRQRIAIARALLARPRILILDEATSSLDSESEALIQDGLQTLRRSRTTFVIAHRLSTIRSADQILVLEEGRIVERGTHAELFVLQGRYRELHDRQHRFESERFVNPGEELADDAAEG